MYRIWLLGYPGNLGGANTECWHTIKLWRKFGCEVNVIPTWGSDPAYEAKLDAIGVETHHLQGQVQELEAFTPIHGECVVSMCNSRIEPCTPILRAKGCRVVWVNCMCFMFDWERKAAMRGESFDAYMCQSQYQRGCLEDELKLFCRRDWKTYHVRGAFDFEEWPYSHQRRESFTLGRLARGDQDKWSQLMWKLYGQIDYHDVRGAIMGWTEKVASKCGHPPGYVKTYQPNELPARKFYGKIDCLLGLNGGAAENWPRIGLEAMALGIPIVAEDRWGWREMVAHGVSGYLGESLEDLSAACTELALHPEIREEMAIAGRLRVEELANPETLWAGWREIFQDLDCPRTTSPIGELSTQSGG